MLLLLLSSITSWYCLRSISCSIFPKCSSKRMKKPTRLTLSSIYNSQSNWSSKCKHRRLRRNVYLYLKKLIEPFEIWIMPRVLREWIRVSEIILRKKEIQKSRQLRHWSSRSHSCWSSWISNIIGKNTLGLTTRWRKFKNSKEMIHCKILLVQMTMTMRKLTPMRHQTGMNLTLWLLTTWSTTSTEESKSRFSISEDSNIGLPSSPRLWGKFNSCQF